MYRIGNGIDFHKLEINPSRPLVLGGLECESEFALVGHSDADIILHAISDAILGASALGDIGQYFPDTDPSLKNMDSKMILAKCLELMKQKGFDLVNVDCTVIGEKPKIAPLKEKIIKSLSSLLNLPLDCVSVKATTTEKMGALGRQEGIGTFCSVLLEKRF
ncbi:MULTISPECIES: 2-C-methyl-D-erythritol 2,4-cyclodiphosphate synthase [Leptospira]|uniref:2-C-methyl-D-erythritol 2,4-cyclodiphosphate synthase n=1 Tax=Leptospira kirschneri serovar Pomona TaxID=561005 RepID=A0A1T1DIH9_9LEPT|nr:MULTISPECIES: 2-C-methyl-D-erythritol 2,4-cyclodiphosphate synthase [Leptospira]EMJ94676.1 2-C-methyl-D-erythritol 2,4-cyclodiphosphate synthase [Leptospira kirschneri str. JB]EMK08681.1 2-C-methyl-D-erythritol 2,4-cyclodiphosphate synthase [Leptospira kirschneri]KXZ28742.1 2-C-methyl-D-erythritol 2,4-cyclodiphosphate synthase [Leptospira kirschneri]KXZ33532.1 2-C-methyl-D-erythritol 2,4-cyclodiphosphate synthase [Leptospira sp. ZV016]OOV40632.1 2-C-methyl-D-erythritol 2,4-cyclodiphosphate 